MTVKKKKPTTKKVKSKASPAKASARPKPSAKRAPSKGAKKGGAKPAARKSAPASRKTKRVVRKAKRPSPKPSRAKLPKKPKAPRSPTPTPVTNPIGYAVAQRLAHVAIDKKATDVVILDTGLRSAAVGYDYIVLASGESDRQLTAIADAARDALKPHGKRPLSVEVSPDWVAMDFGDVVAHLFLPDRRGLTDIEGMWTDAPRVALAAELPALPLAPVAQPVAAAAQP